MIAQKGAYRVEGSTFILCPNVASCLGGKTSECAAGFRDMLCQRCEHGYYRSGVHGCRKCSEPKVLIYLGNITFIGLCLVYIIRRTRSATKKARESEERRNEPLKVFVNATFAFGLISSISVSFSPAVEATLQYCHIVLAGRIAQPCLPHDSRRELHHTRREHAHHISPTLQSQWQGCGVRGVTFSKLTLKNHTEGEVEIDWALEVSMTTAFCNGLL